MSVINMTKIKIVEVTSKIILICFVAREIQFTNEFGGEQRKKIENGTRKMKHEKKKLLKNETWNITQEA